MSPAPALDRVRALAHRLRAQQLDGRSRSLAEVAVLDLGVQDTGPDGGARALLLRGAAPDEVAGPDLALAWTLRTAPHLHRRADLAGVAAALEPRTDAEAAALLGSAAKPLQAAGIGALEGLEVVTDAVRAVVTAPTVKGEASGRVSARLQGPHLRDCPSCGTTHVHELSFRLGALRAGLELERGTLPPVLRPSAQLAAGSTGTHDPGSDLVRDLVRAALHLLGPTTPQQVAAHLGTAAAGVRARWPEDAVRVEVEGRPLQMLAADAERAASGEPAPGGTWLLDPYDPYLQARELLVPDRARAKQLWPVLARPGALVIDGEVAGTWRARRAGARLAVAVALWDGVPEAVRSAVQVQAERLAESRGVPLARVDVSG